MNTRKYTIGIIDLLFFRNWSFLLVFKHFDCSIFAASFERTVYLEFAYLTDSWCLLWNNLSSSDQLWNLSILTQNHWNKLLCGFCYKCINLLDSHKPRNVKLQKQWYILFWNSDVSYFYFSVCGASKNDDFYEVIIMVFILLFGHFMIDWIKSLWMVSVGQYKERHLFLDSSLQTVQFRAKI